jgi:hypothetical protein
MQAKSTAVCNITGMTFVTVKKSATNSQPVMHAPALPRRCFIRELDSARAYAEAALADFQIFRERTRAQIKTTERLIADIDRAVAEKQGGA